MSEASPSLVRMWLTEVAIRCISPNIGDLKVKIQAYAVDLRFPVICFTDETRLAAARRFEWFPAFSKLYEFFNGVAAEHWRVLARLSAIANLKEVAKPSRISYAALSEEDRAEMDALLANFYKRQT